MRYGLDTSGNALSLSESFLETNTQTTMQKTDIKALVGQLISLLPISNLSLNEKFSYIATREKTANDYVSQRGLIGFQEL